MHDLEKYFKIEFKKAHLLETALTHSSYANEHNIVSNERLEFIGDAVLDVIISKYLYQKHPEANEGELSKKRAAYVCETALYNYANRCHLGRYIHLSQGEEKAGGRERKALLADAFEAFMGAVFMDQGLQETYKIANKIIIPFIEKQNNNDFIDYKSHLQELVQSDKRTLKYRIASESGPSHDKIFTSQVYMNDILMGEGQGHSKKQAEQEAAHAALMKLAKTAKGVMPE